jgi:hypothetical protein
LQAAHYGVIGTTADAAGVTKEEVSQMTFKALQTVRRLLAHAQAGGGGAESWVECEHGDYVSSCKKQHAELREVAGVLEQFVRQQERWQQPMPEFPGAEAVYVWALKAQEELGELSAALLGGLIGKEGRGDALEECDQLIAVLLRVRSALARAQQGGA